MWEDGQQIYYNGNTNIQGERGDEVGSIFNSALRGNRDRYGCGFQSNQ